MRALVASVVLIAFVSAAGCGSSGEKKNPDGGSGSGGAGGGGANSDGAVDGAVNDPSCGSFTPCGGDIVGTWRYQSGCGWMSSSSCPAYRTVTMMTSGNPS